MIDDAYSLARAIYERHRAQRLTRPRARSVPRWEELTVGERQKRTEQARRLIAAYAREEVRESAIR